MCSSPNIPPPVRYQQSQTPVYREGGAGPSSQGRRGTILTRGMSSSNAGGATALTSGLGATAIPSKRQTLGA